MRYVLATAVALVLGLVLGGLSPRAEVRRLEAKVVELEERARRPVLAAELVRAIRRAPTEEPPLEPGDPQVAERPEVEETPPSDGPPDGEDDDDFAEGRTILAARRAQARVALIEGANPTAEQLDRFDAAVADMNAEFRAFGEDLLARVRELGGPPPRTELYLYAADGLDVVIETEARIRDALGAQADLVDPEAIDPLSHVDPSLVDLLIELEQAGFDE